MSPEVYEALRQCWRKGLKLAKIKEVISQIDSSLTIEDCQRLFKEMFFNELGKTNNV